MIFAFVQARMGSTRLPGKVMKNINKKPLIWHVIDRLKYSKNINKIIILTTINKKDDVLFKWCRNHNLEIFRGDEENVVKRFYDAAINFKLSDNDIIIRITSDDPFKDPLIIDKMIDILTEKKLDFIFNNCPPTFPEGLDIEIFRFSLLKNNIDEIQNSFDKQHVTQYFYRMTEIKKENFFNSVDQSDLRWTIDTIDDLKMTRKIYKLLYQENNIFTTNDIINLLENKVDIKNINKNVKRSFMYEKDI